MSSKQRSKDWYEKVEIVNHCYLRAKQNKLFAKYFYKNLFFLNPEIESYFKDTDFKYQEKALINGLDILFLYFTDDENGRTQVTRLAKVHNINGLKVHPHYYYYWVEALIMTTKKFDKDWFDDLEYYIREVISFPVSFFISQYFIE